MSCQHPEAVPMANGGRRNLRAVVLSLSTSSISEVARLLDFAPDAWRAKGAGNSLQSSVKSCTITSQHVTPSRYVWAIASAE
eukprot:scaffold115689_cov32-Tisochrysis_lutea.AAC.1